MNKKKFVALGLIVLLSIMLIISSPSAFNMDKSSSTNYFSGDTAYNLSAKPYINGGTGHIVISLTSPVDATKTFIINGRKISLNNNKSCELNTTDFEIPSGGAVRTLEINEENSDDVVTLNVEFESNGSIKGNNTIIPSTSNISKLTPFASSYGAWLDNDEGIMKEWLAQIKDYTCGPHTIVKSIYNFVGNEYSEMSIATNYGHVIGEDGTSHEQLEGIYSEAAHKAGFDIRFNWYSLNEIGWGGIRDAVNDQNKNVIIHDLYKNTWGHYEFILNVNTNSKFVRLDNSLPATSEPWGGWIEDRSFDTMQQYMSGISQKSVLVVTHWYY
ncbi:MAG: hypothetical protein LBB45_07690 [Methanobrevibacter sp.]|nr:hypothetical protein [Candidatus Methanovirga basalitermitum]